MFPKSKANEEARLSPGTVVGYEQHGRFLIGVLFEEEKGKWRILNLEGAELNIRTSRLYALPGTPLDIRSSHQELSKKISSLRDSALEMCESTDLVDAWELLQTSGKETTPEELADLLFGEFSQLNVITAYYLLLDKQLYFKRKGASFIPRSPDAVEALKVQQAVEDEKNRMKEELSSAILQRLKNKGHPLPQSIENLEQLAAYGAKAKVAKDYTQIVIDVLQKKNLPFNGPIEDKTLQLLIALNHFDEDVDLNFLKAHRPKHFSKHACDEIPLVKDRYNQLLSKDRIDLTHLLTVSIDGEDTKDFDDAISLVSYDDIDELWIHISDVASLITKDSNLDSEIFLRGTSIYLADRIEPMLPPSLSEDLLSLKEGEPKLALSVKIRFSKDREILDREIIPSVVQVDKNLSYNFVNDELYAEADSSHNCTPQISRLLHQLWDIVSYLETRRILKGALQLHRRDLIPKLQANKKIFLAVNNDTSPGNKLVGELMILANETAAITARDNSFPLIFRSQPPPDVDLENAGEDIPEGPAREYYLRSLLKRSVVSTLPESHAGLGIECYSQSTSPIRRAVDLINQRQLKAHLDPQLAPLDSVKLQEVFHSLDTVLDEAQHLQISRQRYWLLKYLKQEKLKYLEGTVVKIDGPKPLAELTLTRTLVPFTPLNFSPTGKKRRQKNLGQHVLLKIDKLEPRREILRLVETQEN